MTLEQNTTVTPFSRYSVSMMERYFQQSDWEHPDLRNKGKNWGSYAIPDHGSAIVNGGGATAVIGHGGVGRHGTVIAIGGGASITVLGDVGDNARLIAIGGAATIVVHRNIGADVEIYASGGRATVVQLGVSKGNNVTVIGGGSASLTR